MLLDDEMDECIQQSPKRDKDVSEKADKIFSKKRQAKQNGVLAPPKKKKKKKREDAPKGPVDLDSRGHIAGTDGVDTSFQSFTAMIPQAYTHWKDLLSDCEAAYEVTCFALKM